MCKRLLLALFCGPLAWGQAALQHNGGMALHPGSQLGFHTHLINQAPLQAQGGLVGFYGSNPLSVSGTAAPVFFDLEIFRTADVDLNLSVFAANAVNFIEGDFWTDRALSDRYLGLLQDAFTNGENNLSKVNGSAAAINKQEILFPVGDASELKGLTLQGSEPYPFARCAYFREDPNFPSIYPQFRTDLKPQTVEFVSTFEFWRLEGSVPGTITLPWTPGSNLAAIADNPANIILMGWVKSGQRWIELGTTAVAGDLSNGFAVSEAFVPDDFEIITFGVRAVAEELTSVGNFYISPNNDGLNDQLIIPELLDSPNNEIYIYDRRGLLVYQKENYTDEFTGISNVDGLVFDRQAGLPEGIYFYVIRLFDLATEHQGFLYLRR